MLKIQGKGKGESFEGVKQRDNDYCNVLYNKRFRYTLYTTTGCYCGNKQIKTKKKKMEKNSTHLLKLKKGGKKER